MRSQRQIIHGSVWIGLYILIIVAPYGIDVLYHFHRQISLIAFGFLLVQPLILILATLGGIATFGVMGFIVGQQLDLIVAGDPPQSEGADGHPGRQQGNDRTLKFLQTLQHRPCAPFSP